MLEAQLREKLTRIFDLQKVTFDSPGESVEQEVLFVNIASARSTIKENQHLARVTGQLTVYANGDKLPLGYFSKRIAEADPLDTIDFFFFDFEESVGRMLDIAERSVGFVYFFNGQYDPQMGIINQLNVQVIE